VKWHANDVVCPSRRFTHGLTVSIGWPYFSLYPKGAFFSLARYSQSPLRACMLTLSMCESHSSFWTPTALTCVDAVKTRSTPPAHCLPVLFWWRTRRNQQTNARHKQRRHGGRRDICRSCPRRICACLVPSTCLPCRYGRRSESPSFPL
jgi:hypothetical protein